MKRPFASSTLAVESLRKTGHEGNSQSFSESNL